MPVVQMLKELDLPVVADKFFKLNGPDTAFYITTDKKFRVTVDLRVGLVTSVTVLTQSIGLETNGRRVFVGDPVDGLVHERWELDERTGVLIHPQQEGLYLELDDPDPLPEQLNELTVEGITVYSPQFELELSLKESNFAALEILRTEMLEFWRNHRS